MTSFLQTPLIFLTFNRPYHTKKVFARIREVKPQRLFLVSDGPRPNILEDENNCAQVRQIIANIDWECEVSENFANANMGLRKRISSGISHAFEQVEEAIILEDDCLPELDFFRFCTEMLRRYKDQEKIMAVSGNHFLTSRTATVSNGLETSYYFLRTPLIWGWATWKRAWQYYPDDIGFLYKEIKDKTKARHYFLNKKEYVFFKYKVRQIHHKKQDAWDYLWAIALRKRKGLCICPRVNLVRNIGFGKEATHTSEGVVRFQKSSGRLNFPLKHPKDLDPNDAYDHYIFMHNIYVSLWQRFKDIIASYIFYRFFKAKLQRLHLWPRASA